uniref:CDP-alcohol phosphatidyltransferase family protein n=1 Tax=Acetatifactor sp. TaxID=1872090 RepID=UPI004057057E
MKKENKLSIPNLITSTRIVGAICMLFTRPMSISFFVLYTLCGISDAIDGWVARATKSTTEFGAKLDSIADLLFYTAMAVQVFPFLVRDLPIALWCVAGAVILTRVITYLFVAVKHHRFASIHTYLNKATGFVIFIIPYFIVCAGTVLICSIVGLISSLATIEELLIHLCSKEYPPKAKTLFQLRKNADMGVSA